jgi:hypothetical protein
MTAVQASTLFHEIKRKGTPQEVAAAFTNRREDLREWTFWKNTFAEYKDRILSRDRFASLIELSEVRTARRSKIFPHNPLREASMADTMQHTLEWLDQSIENGPMTRAQAVQWLDRYISDMVTNLDRHSEQPR